MPTASAAKPRLSEIARSAMAFDRFALHISCRQAGIAHAILAFDPAYAQALAARAATAFPRMSARQALFLALDHELGSDEARVALNLAHGYSESRLAAMEREPEADPDEEPFFAPEPARRRVATLSRISPNSLLNPTIEDRVCALHLDLAVGRAGMAGEAVDFGASRPPAPSPERAALAIAPLLAGCLGPAGLCLIPGWSQSDPYVEPNFSAERKSSQFAQALQAALDQAILSGTRTGAPSPEPRRI